VTPRGCQLWRLVLRVASRAVLGDALRASALCRCGCAFRGCLGDRNLLGPISHFGRYACFWRVPRSRLARRVVCASERFWRLAVRSAALLKLLGFCSFIRWLSSFSLFLVFSPRVRRVKAIFVECLIGGLCLSTWLACSRVCTVLEVNGLLPPIGFGGERHCTLEDCLWGICLAGGLRVEFRLGSCWNLHSVEQCSVCCVSRVALECDFSWGGCKRATCPFRTFRVLYWKPLCSRPVGAS